LLIFSIIKLILKKKGLIVRLARQLSAKYFRFDMKRNDG
jgi:hypothetical protein